MEGAGKSRLKSVGKVIEKTLENHDLNWWGKSRGNNRKIARKFVGKIMVRLSLSPLASDLRPLFAMVSLMIVTRRSPCLLR
ncbi:hypothetical protein TIFTF001_010626 [Ficus carica]|uniref:Uncharacterized protein n=1 Tax=Ficus carica TaxID=3494 RepID=A0AA87ZXB4_FICCA|nr:hypothetical protein TIFTF001_010626 [Ficus carica]